MSIMLFYTFRRPRVTYNSNGIKNLLIVDPYFWTRNNTSAAPVAIAAAAVAATSADADAAAAVVATTVDADAVAAAAATIPGAAQCASMVAQLQWWHVPHCLNSPTVGRMGRKCGVILI